MKITILYSGGLDSLIMRRWAAVNYPDADVNYVYYDLGQDYAAKELDVLPSDVEVRKVDWLNIASDAQGKEGSSSGGIYIPGRNAVLSTLAACQYQPDEVWLGALMGEVHEGATDKNWTFLEKMSDCLSYVLKPFADAISVKFPLASAGFGKFEAVAWFLENGGTIDSILESSSCLSGDRGDTDNCGKCVVCLRRWGILTQLGFSECYDSDPIADMSEDNKRMIAEMAKGEKGLDCYYDGYRRREIFPALYMTFNTSDPDEVVKCVQ